jgi:hypothetical protein
VARRAHGVDADAKIGSVRWFGRRKAFERHTSAAREKVRHNPDVVGRWRLDARDALRFSVTNLLAQPATSSSIYDDGSGRRESRAVYPFSPIGRLVWERRY